MLQLPIKNPEPDFFSLKKVLEGERDFFKVHFIEFWIDEEIKKFIIENIFNEVNNYGLTPIVIYLLFKELLKS